MNPVIIYSLPRTKATAAMTACKRSEIYLQPFTFKDFKNISAEEWNSTLTKVNNADSVSRIRGSDIANSELTKNYWNNVIIKNNAHDIFVIERLDRVTTILSYFTSKFFGFNKFEEVEPYEVTVPDSLFDEVEFHVRSYIEHFPLTGKVYTFETLPESHFDKFLTTHPLQNSKEKFKYLTNLGQCFDVAHAILDKHGADWDERIKSVENHLFDTGS